LSKQTKPIRRNCQRENCVRDAVIGIYRWNQGETGVNLDRPVMVVCGQHKPRWTSPNQMHRNVRLRTA